MVGRTIVRTTTRMPVGALGRNGQEVVVTDVSVLVSSADTVFGIDPIAEVVAA